MRDRPPVASSRAIAIAALSGVKRNRSMTAGGAARAKHGDGISV